MSISRKFVLRAGLLAVVWTASALLAEGIFRLAGIVPADDLSGLYAQFGRTGYVHRPRVRTTADWYSGRFEVYTDDLGLRCGKSDRAAVTSGANIDVLVCGDSQGFGNGLDFEDSIAGALQARADRVGITVANSSVGGQTLADQMRLVEWLRHEKRVSYHVLLVLVTPRMIAKGSGLNRVFVDSDGRLYGKEPNSAMRLRTWAKTHVALYTALRDSILNLFSREQNRSTVLNLYVVGDSQASRVREFCDMLRRTKDQTDAVVVIVYTPLVLEIGGEALARAAKQSGITVDFEAPWRIVERAAIELELPIIDLRPVLRREKAKGVSLSLKGDHHYNAETSRACSAEIWESLVERGLVIPHNRNP